MRLNVKTCRKCKTVKHTLPSGGLAITLPDGRLVAYKKSADRAWDWIKKGFQFFGKRGVDKA